MIEINMYDTIEQSIITGMDPDKLEELIQDNIAEGLAKEMRKHIDEMSFIDMQYNQETKAFDITAELVLCSKQDIITNADMMAKKLADYGLSEEQILDVLETQLNDNGGF